MRPAASFTDGFRFESGNQAKALVYDIGKTGAARWTDEIFTLQQAASIGLGAAFTALLLVCQ